MSTIQHQVLLTDTTSQLSVSGGGNTSAPATPALGRLIEMVSSYDASAIEVATSLHAALSADAAFTTTRSDNVVLVTDLHAGTRANIVDGASATGFTLSTTQAGSDLPVVHVKSTGASQVVVGIAPD